MSNYRFLFDQDVRAAADALPPHHVVPFAKLGLPDDASDVAIIETARRQKCIIVTANGEHFRPAAVKFIRQSSRRRTGGCHDLSGLVVLPSGLEAQRRLLREAPQRMRYEGKLVGWADVSGRSYYVKLAKDGPAEVAPLPRCRVCQENARRWAQRRRARR